MGGLTEAEHKQLVDVVARRLGARSDAVRLVTCYLDAMARSAYARTTSFGPVPTSLTAERSAILIEISRGLGRVIEDYEIQALFRVTSAQAKAMRTTLLATYSDIADELSLAWSLRDARNLGRRQGDSVLGTAVRFADQDRRDAFIAYSERLGIGVEEVAGEAANPWLVIVADSFPKDKLPAGAD